RVQPPTSANKGCPRGRRSGSGHQPGVASLMGAAIEALQRIGVKLFAADGSSVQPREFVPIFHRWIQTQAVANHLLIDVADYAHVPDGPGVLLVAHEGNFSLDL